MITRIVIENFKSLKKVNLSLGRVNLFLGANASGKSNFLDALRVLEGIGRGLTIREILDGKPRSATGEHGNLSATPFYIQGSGFPEGSPFPWIVSDFSLVDAIESGITKIPRLPAIDNTGRPDPKYFRLWDHITKGLGPGDRLPGGKPKPEAVYREAEDALLTLAGEWKERFEQ